MMTIITTSKKAETDYSFSNTPAFGFQCIHIQEKENSNFFQKQNIITRIQKNGNSKQVHNTPTKKLVV